ncbi:DUF5723 family protein [Maribacter chungangensis]|uniref:DUF5723 family protein n=1 Tax=Maribacter chungangensis TaxID=1069117 RepID=A0ABW3AYP8_9FLAO
MKKTAALILFFCVNFGFSQSYMGYTMDNFSGIHNTIHNPANLADSRTKWEFNLFSASGTLSTDYTNLTLGNISNLLGDSGFDGLERFASDQNNFLLDADVVGPSLQFSLNEKSGLALVTRVRAISNFNNVNGALFESIYDGFPTSSFAFEQNNLDFATHAWGEVGLSYGRVFLANPNHVFKGGITLKYLLGGGAVQGGSNTLTGNFNDATGQVRLDGDISYALTIDDGTTSIDYFEELAPGFGADIGFVYEFRNAKSIAPSNNNNPRAFNQYKLKVGLSILDLGSINYTGTEVTEYTINANVNAQELENDFIDIIEDNATATSTLQDVKWSLPTTLQLNLDYSVTPKLYINLNVGQGMVNKNEFFNNNRLNLITLTPRFESRVFGAYLPISHSSLSNTAIGLGLRLGPLTLGSSSVVSNLMGSKSQLAHLFLGLKIPVYHKRSL